MIHVFWMILFALTWYIAIRPDTWWKANFPHLGIHLIAHYTNAALFLVSAIFSVDYIMRTTGLIG